MGKFISLVFLVFPLFCFGQQKIIIRNVDKQGVINHLVFDNTESFIPMDNAKQLLHDTLKLSKEDNFILLKEIKDELGFTRQIYEQHFRGIKIEDGLFGVFGRNGKIEYITGEFKKVKNVEIIPTISEKEALEKALNYINATKYRWQIPSEESKIKIDKKNSTATFYPKGELLICRDKIITDSIYNLAYKFDIFAVKPLSHKIYYVDAVTGVLLDIRNLIFDTNTNATGTSLYRGTVSFTTDSYNGAYRLYEIRSNNNVVIHTYDANNLDDFSGTAEISHDDTIWPSDTAIDAQWGAEKVYDYWLASPRNRNSLDGNGMAINGYVHFSTGWDNASWTGEEILYGDGYAICKAMVALDMIGHEAGHAIMQYTANFSTSSGGETNSLNEGFSDIWGAVIEHWVAPHVTNNWLHGDQIMRNGKLCSRSLRSPKTEGYNNWTETYPGGFPNTYTGTYWINSSGCNPNGGNDFCYCHTNCTVLDYWFYLLSQGASNETNDLNNTYTVFGLSIDSAAKIVWRAENNSLSLHPNAQYSDVVAHTIQAATDLYGSNSIQEMQVKNAWYAVGFGTQPSQMRITGPWILCSSGHYYTLHNPASGTLTWQTSSNIQRLSGQGSNPCNFKSISSGWGWIQASINGIPGPKKTVWSGKFESTIVTGTAGVCPNRIYTYTAQVPGGDSSYTYSWTYPSNWYYYSKYKNNITLQTPSNPYYGTVRVAITNGCGTSGYSGITVYPGYGCGGYYSMYPNPASDEVTITINEPETIVTENEDISGVVVSKVISTDQLSFTIRIYNSLGTLVSTAKRSGTSFKLPIVNLQDGTYIVELSDGKNIYREQLVVKRD